MSHQWPAETAFRQVDLYVRGQVCAICATRLHVCAHRRRRLFTLKGPCLLVARLGHCPDPGCQGHQGTVSPLEEMGIAPPRLAVGWDVFAWIGHRRFARHWSVPQICAELSDSHAIDLSEDAIEDYVRQYAVMVAARHTDLEQMQKAYAETTSLQPALALPQPAVPNGETAAATLTAEVSTRDEDLAEAGALFTAGHMAAKPSPAGQVVLDYCAVVRGILNDDQGGPLHPPGLRMADALVEVRPVYGAIDDQFSGGVVSGARSLNCRETIWTWSDGFASPKATSGESMAGVMQESDWSTRGRPWLARWTLTCTISARSLRTNWLPITPLSRLRHNRQPSPATASCARPVHPNCARTSWQAWNSDTRD